MCCGRTWVQSLSHLARENGSRRSPDEYSVLPLLPFLLNQFVPLVREQGVMSSPEPPCALISSASLSLLQHFIYCLTLCQFKPITFCLIQSECRVVYLVRISYWKLLVCFFSRGKMILKSNTKRNNNSHNNYQVLFTDTSFQIIYFVCLAPSPWDGVAIWIKVQVPIWSPFQNINVFCRARRTPTDLPRSFPRAPSALAELLLLSRWLPWVQQDVSATWCSHCCLARK